MIVDKILANNCLTKEDYSEYNSYCTESNLCPLRNYIDKKLESKKKEK